jgi:histone deacetylase complex subunit SAP30
MILPVLIKPYLQTLMKHFKTIQVKEKEVVTFFIYTVKTNSNKLDQKNGVNNDAT